MKCKQMWRLHVAAVEEEEGMLIRHHYQEHLKKKNVLTDQKKLGNEDVISTRYLQKKNGGGGVEKRKHGQISKLNCQNRESVSCCFPTFSPFSIRAAVCAIKRWATPACMKRPALYHQVSANHLPCVKGSWRAESCNRFAGAEISSRLAMRAR